jgi:hypothetical protein
MTLALDQNQRPSELSTKRAGRQPGVGQALRSCSAVAPSTSGRTSVGIEQVMPQSSRGSRSSSGIGGNRTATLWLAHPFGARIDQIEVRIWNANGGRVAATTFPIEAQWTDADGAADGRQTKAWTAEMTAGQRERMAAALSGADETGGLDPFDLIFLCVPDYFLLQLALALRTSGGWRRAALVPAVIMVPILAYTAWPLPRSPTCGRFS